MATAGVINVAVDHETRKTRGLLWARHERYDGYIVGRLRDVLVWTRQNFEGFVIMCNDVGIDVGVVISGGSRWSLCWCSLVAYFCIETCVSKRRRIANTRVIH